MELTMVAYAGDCFLRDILCTMRGSAKAISGQSTRVQSVGSVLIQNMETSRAYYSNRRRIHNVFIAEWAGVPQ